MPVLDSLKNLFSRRKTIADVSVDELRRERIRLEQEESKLARRIQEVEGQKQDLFVRGKDETSTRQQRIVARKIKELDMRAKNMDKNLQLFSRQLRIINGFTQLKENQRLLEQSGISSIIRNVDLQTLQNYVDQATIDGVFQMDRLSDILTTLEESEKIVGLPSEEPDIEAIVAAMQEAKAAEEIDSELALEEGLRKVDQVLGKEETEEAAF